MAQHLMWEEWLAVAEREGSMADGAEWMPLVESPESAPEGGK